MTRFATSSRATWVIGIAHRPLRRAARTRAFSRSLRHPLSTLVHMHRVASTGQFTRLPLYRPTSSLRQRGDPMPGDEYFPADAAGKRPQRDDRRQPSSRGRVPPHNIEAEESVLGALLLSREAIGVVSEMGLNPSDFYKPAHRHIFDAIRSLYSSGAPADTVTVADELRRAGLLAEVGGAETLHELQNTTPSISSAGHYAKIVQETALLRQLIFAAGDIAELAYSEPDDVDQGARHGGDQGLQRRRAARRRQHAHDRRAAAGGDGSAPGDVRPRRHHHRRPHRLHRPRRAAVRPATERPLHRRRQAGDGKVRRL